MPAAACRCGSPHPPLPRGELHLEVEALLLPMGSRALLSYALTQRQAIEQATAQSLAKAGAYSDEVLAGSLKALDRAAKDVKAQILALGDLSQFGPGAQPGKSVQLVRLKVLETHLAQTAAQLKQDLTLAYQGMTGDLAKAGIEGKLAQLGAQKLGGYQALDQAGREALAEAAFSLVPTDALDFLSNYQLQLLGKLSDDLVAGIKGAVQVGIAQGEGPAKIARRIGGIVKDPEEFRQAGKTVFKTVQQRAELIARSETMRAYNQGAKKFETQIGVKSARWLTAGDERECPECGSLDGREFDLQDLPSQPLHPACRCTHMPGGSLSQITDLGTLEAQLADQALGDGAVQEALKSGDYGKLTMVQLREVAKEKGVSIARTKADRLVMLSEMTGHSDSWLAGHTPVELDAWFKKYKIGALKTKDELLSAIHKADHATDAAKAAALKQAEEAAKKAKQAAEEAAKKTALADQATADFHTTLVKLKDLEADPAQFQAFHQQMDQLLVHVQKHLEILGPKKAADLGGYLSKAQDAFTLKVELTGQSALRDVLKAAKVKNFQWFTKAETVTYLTQKPLQSKIAEQVAAKVAAAKEAAKLKKVAPPAKPATPKPAAPKPAPKATPAVQARSADEAWEALKAENPFTFHSDASELGGVHTKYFYTDKAGDKWLFKPIAEEFRAFGDEVAYLIQREIDPGAIEVRTIRLKDMHGRMRSGSIQKMKQGLKDPHSFEKMDLAALTPAELAQIQREQVVDWLISNHDGHAGQFLRARDGKVYGIDKGQLFKFFGKDKLSVDYAPNAGGRFDEPLINKLLRAHRDGKIKLDLRATQEWIRRVEAIPDAAYREMLMPYAGRRFAGQPGALQDFLRAAVERKNAIRGDFERFYSEIESARLGRKVSFRFGQAVEEAAAPPAADGGTAWARGSRVDLKEEVKAIRESGWQGRSLAVDKGDIEDQNVLVREVSLSGGGKRTTLQFKMRPDADRNLVAFLEANATGGDLLAQAPVDPYWGRVLEAVKTLNHHATSDLKFNVSKVDLALDLRKELLALGKSSSPLERAMAKRYLAILDDVEKARVAQIQGRAATIPQVRQYKPTAAELRNASKTPQAQKGDGIQVRRRERWTEDKTRIHGKHVEVVEDNVPLTEFYRGGLRDNLREFEIDLGDGVTAVYKPFQKESLRETLVPRLSDERAFAMQGRMTVRIDGAASDTGIAKAMERLKRLGIDATPSTALDEELMYLQKTAYAATVDKTPAFVAAADQAREASSTEEAVRIWRAAWSNHLGVKDVTKLLDYDPVGVHQMATATGKSAGAGTRVQYRFDVGKAVIEKEMKDYVLTHKIYSGSIHDFFETVLPTNRAFIPTAERFSVGVPIGGMSPGRDLDTGGASYFFTRIAKRATLKESRILLKTEMLGRADAISYNTDNFGKVIGDFVSMARHTTPKGWKACVRSASNETIFKGTIPILDNLEGVFVKSQTERNSLINLFKRHNIEVLPDGRKIEDVIVTNMASLKRTP